MLNIQTPKRVYAPADHVKLSCCRLCKSVGDNISHSKNLFAKNNRALLICGRTLRRFLVTEQTVACCYVWYVGSCRPCERRVNNFKAFKNMIMETLKFLERTHFPVN